MDYTREQLIEICERAIVQEKDWNNRDSSDAQRQLGETWALLKAGCEFYIRRSGGCATNESTIWIEIEFDGFNVFEYGRDEGNKESETSYLPTEKRLEQRKGKDWY